MKIDGFADARSADLAAVLRGTGCVGETEDIA